jgi:hypothetical protein
MATTSAIAAAASSTNRCIQKYITTIKAMSESTANAYISAKEFQFIHTKGMQ